MGRALLVDMKARSDGAPPTDLIAPCEAFKANLINDITETIAYGLFAARLHDDTSDTFSRGAALELRPKSNPFLREFFVYIAGPTLDEHLRRVIDELCDIFQATSMPKVLANFGKFTGRADPFSMLLVLAGAARSASDILSRVAGQNPIKALDHPPRSKTTLPWNNVKSQTMPSRASVGTA